MSLRSTCLGLAWAAFVVAGCGRTSSDEHLAREEAREEARDATQEEARVQPAASPPEAALRLAPSEPGARGSEPREGYVEALRTLHSEVDAAREPETRRAALEHIERLYPDDGGLPARAVGPLRQDLAGRAARLALSLSRPEEARRWAERGLAEPEGQPFFRANLLVELADAERALGRPDVARRHLQEALNLNRELLDRELAQP